MFAKHAFTTKKPQLWPYNHLNPHFVNHMPKFQDISWDQLVAGEVAIILQAKYHMQALRLLCLLKKLLIEGLDWVICIKSGNSTWQ